MASTYCTNAIPHSSSLLSHPSRNKSSFSNHTIEAPSLPFSPINNPPLFGHSKTPFHKHPMTISFFQRCLFKNYFPRLPVMILKLWTTVWTFTSTVQKMKHYHCIPNYFQCFSPLLLHNISTFLISILRKMILKHLFHMVLRLIVLILYTHIPP